VIAERSERTLLNPRALKLVYPIPVDDRVTSQSGVAIGVSETQKITVISSREAEQRANVGDLG
jgi:hypothetical protein